MSTLGIGLVLVSVVVHTASALEHSIEESTAPRHAYTLTAVSTTSILMPTPSLDTTCRGMLMLHTACSNPVRSTVVTL